MAGEDEEKEEQEDEQTVESGRVEEEEEVRVVAVATGVKLVPTQPQQGALALVFGVRGVAPVDVEAAVETVVAPQIPSGEYARGEVPSALQLLRE